MRKEKIMILENEKVLIKGNVLVKYNEKNTDSAYRVPKRIEAIGDYAFSGNSDLKEIYLTRNIRKLGHCVFSNCPNLFKIYYPGTMAEWMKVTYIPEEMPGDPVLICSDGDILLRAGIKLISL